MKRFAALTLVLLLSDLGLFGRTTLAPGWNLYSPAQDVQLGRQAQAQIERQVHLVNDPQLNRYVSNLGRQLVRNAPNADYPFTFKVVKDKSINAFALPGGPVYVNTGTIEAAENESQLAGVMAHEIGHVVLRHSTNSLSKQSIARGGLAIMSGVLGRGAYVAAFGLNSAFLKYSRDHERQADLMGAQILYDSKQWDPNEMARFFEKLEQQSERSGGRPVEFFSDHPNPGNRVQLVSGEVQTLGPIDRRAFAAHQEESEFPEMRRIAANINHGLPARSGSLESAAQAPQPPASPSAGGGSMTAYNARTFRILYPGHWRVIEKSSTVSMGPADSIGPQGVSNGALIGFEDPNQIRQNYTSLDDATHHLVENIRKGNSSVRLTSTIQRVTVGGLAGDSVTMTSPSMQGGQEIDWLLTALRPDGTLWYIIFVANERDYQQLRPVFQQMIESVRLAN